MTTTWIDTPGAPLATKHDAIDFSLDREATAVSVRFDGAGARVEERAYRDGEWLYPYRDSTKTGLTFSLKRTGGWPSAPTVYIDEQPAPAVVPTTFWQVLLDVDFTALPSGAISGASGSVGSSGSIMATLAGIPWNIKWYNSGAMAGTVQSGLGVKLTAYNFNDYSAYGGAYFFTSQTNIAGWDESKWHCVQAKFRHPSDPTALPAGMLVGAYATSWNAAALPINPPYDSRWGCHAAMYNHSQFQRYASHYGNGTGYQGALVFSGGIFLTIHDAGVYRNLRDYTFAVMTEPEGGGRYGYLGYKRGNQGFCPLEEMTPIGACYAGYVSPHEMLGAFFGFIGSGQSCDRYLSHLRVLQKGMVDP